MVLIRIRIPISSHSVESRVILLEEEMLALPKVAHFLQDHKLQQVSPPQRHMNRAGLQAPRDPEDPGLGDHQAQWQAWHGDDDVAERELSQGSSFTSQYQRDTKIIQNR